MPEPRQRAALLLNAAPASREYSSGPVRCYINSCGWDGEQWQLCSQAAGLLTCLPNHHKTANSPNTVTF